MSEYIHIETAEAVSPVGLIAVKVCIYFGGQPRISRAVDLGIRAAKQMNLRGGDSVPKRVQLHLCMTSAIRSVNLLDSLRKGFFMEQRLIALQKVQCTDFKNKFDDEESSVKRSHSEKVTDSGFARQQWWRIDVD